MAMNIFRSARWLDKFNYNFQSARDVPNSKFLSVNSRLDNILSSRPVVSIVIGAWNEEVNIIKCIDSLSYIETTIPFEIIVVNNNSTDQTQVALDRLHVKSFFQPIQGNGPARQMGQENAKGQYILLADADCLYPTCWLDMMFAELSKPGVVCVYGRYSFFQEEGYPRWKLFILEKLKDIIAEVRHYKRPYLNAFGISMGYVKKYGLKEGFINRNIRGNDGRLCFDLMNYGKIKQMKNRKARVWTGPRTLERDGSFSKALFRRVKIESRRFFSLFKSHPPHDTKTSNNQ